MILQDYLDQLQETPKRTTATRITRATKIKKATGQLASSTARKQNDPLYKRMVYFRDQYFKYRDQIHRKYTPRVRSRAMR
jgi:hypothetical protein